MVCCATMIQVHLDAFFLAFDVELTMEEAWASRQTRLEDDDGFWDLKVRGRLVCFCLLCFSERLT